MFDKRYILGILSGVILFLVPFNIVVLMPLAILCLLIFINRYSMVALSLFQKVSIPIFVLLIVTNILSFKLDELQVAMPYLVYPAALLLASVVKVERSFVVGIAHVIFIIFFIDCVFNAYTLVTGNDLLGRVVDYRPGDFLPRGGGFYGTSFSSIGLSLSALIGSLVTKNRFILFLLFIFMPLSGSLRSSVLLLVAVIGMICAMFVKQRLSFFMLAAMCGSCVLGGIFIFSEASSNILRITALSFGAQEIFVSPFIGSSGYIPIEHEIGISATEPQELLDSGNAEQQLLNIGIHFGIPTLLLFMTIIYSLIPQANNKPNRQHDNFFVKRVSIFIIIVDLLTAHIFSFAPFSVFSLLILLSLDRAPSNSHIKARQ